jgi:Na+/proline symporter
MVTGSVVTVVWHNVPVLKGLVYELVPAFIFALVAVVVGSLLTKPPTEVDIDD